MLEIRDIGPSNLPDAARLCLAGENPADRPKAFTRDVELECTRCKLAFLYEKMAGGMRAFAAYRYGMLVGYLETHPVEDAPVPVDGKGAHVIACLRVPERGERIEVEHALVEHAYNAMSTSGGLAVVARDKVWAGLGFEEVDRSDAEVIGYDRVLWWRGRDGEVPKLVPIDRNLPRIPGKVRVDIFESERCPWDAYVLDMVRGVAERMANDVVVFETDCTKRRTILRTGVVSAVAVNGRFQAWFRPHVLPDEHTIRRVLENAA